MLVEIASMENVLRKTISERDKLNIEILQIQENIRAIQKMYFADALAEKGRQLTVVGLTEAVRILLRKQRDMTAANVKMGLELLGFELERFKNPAAAVHNTLLRMTKAGELVYNAATDTYRFADTGRRNKAFYGE